MTSFHLVCSPISLHTTNTDETKPFIIRDSYCIVFTCTFFLFVNEWRGITRRLISPYYLSQIFSKEKLSFSSFVCGGLYFRNSANRLRRCRDQSKVIVLYCLPLDDSSSELLESDEIYRVICLFQGQKKSQSSILTGCTSFLK